MRINPCIIAAVAVFILFHPLVAEAKFKLYVDDSRKKYIMVDEPEMDLVDDKIVPFSNSYFSFSLIFEKDNFPEMYEGHLHRGNSEARNEKCTDRRSFSRVFFSIC